MTTSAAIVTVGSELVEGLRIDTNTAEIARELTALGGVVIGETVSTGDDVGQLARTLSRLIESYDLVLVTGGLGPTHDDITRDAASKALGLPMKRDPRLVRLLRPLMSRHADPEAAAGLLVQAEVLEGARVLDAVTGTAPGQVIDTGRGQLVLLPGPPTEMRPLLSRLLAERSDARVAPVELGVAGLTESDAQVRASRALASHPGVRLTVLARPGDVKIILVDEGAGVAALEAATDAVAAELGEAVYARDGRSLSASVVDAARAKGCRLACAESCTGGLVTAALTSVPGASDVVEGGIVTYSNQAKIDLLGVPAGLLAQYGAVSEETAVAMAQGARAALGADVAVAVTGVAGPAGGSQEKPVGLVWFGLSSAAETIAVERRFPPMGRDAIRERSVAFALDLFRTALLRR